MNTLPHKVGLSLIAIMLMTACHSSDIIGRQSEDGLKRSSDMIMPLGAGTIDDRLAALTETVPGFGGLFYDADGRLTVYMKDSSAFSGAARAVVGAFLATERNGMRRELAMTDAANARVLLAKYDFRELLSFYRAIVLPAVSTIAGITSGDIDEMKNKIVIGVGSADLIPAARERIARLPIPSDLIEIREVPSTSMNALLTDQLRPIPGGAHAYRVTALDSFPCTLGFNLVRYTGTIYDTVATDRYFVTASHCSTSRNSLDYSDRYQGANVVANEWGDPATFTNSYTSACPSGYICRFADASVFVYNSPSLSDQNHVALAGIGSLSFSSHATVTAVSMPWSGYNVHMIGAKSGRRYATVAATCEDVLSIGGWSGGALLCQGRARYFSQNGDSGAPVVELFGDDTAWAVGIHWGNYLSGGVTHSRFSTMDNVLGEFYTRLSGSPYFHPVQY